MAIKDQVEALATSAAVNAVKSLFPTLIAAQNASANSSPAVGQVKVGPSGGLTSTSGGVAKKITNISSRNVSSGQSMLIVQLPGNVNLGIN